MRSELPLKDAHQNYLMADRRPILQPNRHCQGRQEPYWRNSAPVTADSLYMKRIDPTERYNCHDCGHSPHDTHHIFNCPSKPTTLTEESLWSAPTKTAKHLNVQSMNKRPPALSGTCPVIHSSIAEGFCTQNKRGKKHNMKRKNPCAKEV